MIDSTLALHPSPLIRQDGRLVFSGASSVRVETMGAVGLAWWMLAGAAAFFLWRR